MLALVSLLLSPAAEAAEPPARIESSDPATRAIPVWISAEEAIGSDRGLVWEHFLPWERDKLASAMEYYRRYVAPGLKGDATDPCRYAGPSYADYYVPDPTLADLDKYSEIIFNGIVEGHAQGFYLGSPSTLYRVRVDRVWRGSYAIPDDHIVYLAIGDAAIHVGEGTWLCSRSRRFPDHPERGRRILIFSDREPPWPPIFNPMIEELDRKSVV